MALSTGVRALLAKAEATTYEHEAEAFTAKAQELITRYRIDRMLLETQPSNAKNAVSRRIAVTKPYEVPKAILLSRIADANGCAAVWLQDEGVAAVFGDVAALDAVETLYASLVLQATGALRRHGAKEDILGRSRTKRFRRSFLMAFAARIGQRLADVVSATVSGASSATDRDLVPLMSERARVASAAAAAAFPHTRSVETSASDSEGWDAGRRFADQVELATQSRLSA